MRPGALREDLDDFVGGYGAGRAPTPAWVEYSNRVDAEYTSVMGAYNDFAKLVSALNPALKAAGVSEVTVPPAISP
jgi:hypothetical protein